MVHTHVQNFWWCTYLPSFLLWDLLIEHIHSTIPIELLHIALLYRINAAADYQCCQLETIFKIQNPHFQKQEKKEEKNRLVTFRPILQSWQHCDPLRMRDKAVVVPQVFFGCHPIAVSSIDTVF